MFLSHWNVAPTVSYFLENVKSNVSKKTENDMETKAGNNIDVINLEIVYEHPSWPAGLNDIDLHTLSWS